MSNIVVTPAQVGRQIRTAKSRKRKAREALNLQTIAEVRHVVKTFETPKAE